MRVELTGVRRVDRPIPDLHARPSTGLNGANSAKCNHCGCCSASTQSDEHAGGLPTSTTSSTALCRPPSGSRLRPVAGLLRAGGSQFDDTIIMILCTLSAAVRQPAPAGCRAAARGGLASSEDNICCILLATILQPASAGCRATRCRWSSEHPERVQTDQTCFMCYGYFILKTWMILHIITEADRKKTLESRYLHTFFSVYRQFFTCDICYNSF
jgi:hypothetical protein